VIEKVFFGLASALVFEGLMLAILPNRIKKVVQLIEKTPSTTLSIIGLIMMVIGILFLSQIEI
jgi:uncharacterized protein YjeT (DUF2065 family)